MYFFPFSCLTFKQKEGRLCAMICGIFNSSSGQVCLELSKSLYLLNMKKQSDGFGF